MEGSTLILLKYIRVTEGNPPGTYHYSKTTFSNGVEKLKRTLSGLRNLAPS